MAVINVIGRTHFSAVMLAPLLQQDCRVTGRGEQWIKYTHWCPPRGRWLNGRARPCLWGTSPKAPRSTCPGGSGWSLQTCRPPPSRGSKCPSHLDEKDKVRKGGQLHSSQLGLGRKSMLNVWEKHSKHTDQCKLTNRTSCGHTHTQL